MHSTSVLRGAKYGVLLLLVMSGLSYGQGEFLSGRETMAGVGAGGYFGSEDNRGGNIVVGYSIRGMADYSALAGTQSLGGRNYGFLGLGATLWPAKQGRNSKVISFGLFGQLTRGDKYKTTTFGAILALQTPAGPKSTFVPKVGIGRTSVGTKSWAVTSRNSSTIGLLDLSLVYLTSPKTRLAVTAHALLEEEGNKTFGLSVTVLFGLKLPKEQSAASASPAP